MVAIAEPRARHPKPTVSIVPYAYGTELFFASFPSAAAAGYWATFTESIRDKSP
jgi:hypothetical protein